MPAICREQNAWGAFCLLFEPAESIPRGLSLKKDEGHMELPPAGLTCREYALFRSQFLGLALLPHELKFALLGFLRCRNLFLHLLRRFFQLR